MGLMREIESYPIKLVKKALEAVTPYELNERGRKSKNVRFIVKNLPRTDLAKILRKLSGSRVY